MQPKPAHQINFRYHPKPSSTKKATQLMFDGSILSAILALLLSGLL